MLTRIGFFFFVGVFFFAARCHAADLPAACGPDGARFDVTDHDSASAPGAPPAGKARLILLENDDQYVGPFVHATVRFGMDGAWVGAAKGTSYFTLDVAPGLHHVCANWQSSFAGTRKNVHLIPVNAEAGKTYYLQLDIRVVYKSAALFDFAQLNDDEGAYRVQLAKLATSKQR